jgi:hypothetical protein
MFEDTKIVIRSRKPKKDRERKRTKGQPRNDLQNTTQKINKTEKHEPH